MNTTAFIAILDFLIDTAGLLFICKLNFELINSINGHASVDIKLMLKSPVRIIGILS